MRECSVKRGEIISTDRLKARNCLDFNLFKTSFDFFIDQNRFLPDLSKTLSQYLITCFLMAVRLEVNNLESSAVVQELEFTINRAL